MRVETLGRFPNELDDLARRSSVASFYHTTGWLDALVAAYPSWSPRCLAAWDGGDLVGYLPYFVVKRGMVRTRWSLPFGSYGGPVTVDNGAFARDLVKRFFETRHKPAVFETGMVDFCNRRHDDGHTTESSSTHLIDLQDGFDEIWRNRFDKSKRRQTRRAEREGIVVSEATNAEVVKQYYAIYKARTSEWSQPIHHPERLFTSLIAHPGGGARLFIARAGNRMLGGHLNLYFSDTVIAWNGVVAADDLATQASTLLYSHCIRDACAAGYKTYNLGGSLGKDTLIDYKRSLGGLPYTYQILRRRSWLGKVASIARRRSRGG